jgi:nucleoside-diphosphate-sugar epimerase
MGLFMKILITGDEGFVGRAFHRRHGHHDITGVDLKSGLDCRTFFRTVDKRFDLVIHLAAIVGGRLTIENDPMAIATDLSIDAEMFNWAIRTKQQRIVYFSSSAAYPIQIQMGGRPNNFRLSETDIDLKHVRNPDMTYGWAKLTGEMLAEYTRAYGPKVYVFRPFSGYGTDQDLDYPFPSFIQRAARLDDPFDIWGDGNQTRDFIHINDIVDAVMEAVDKDINFTSNLCSGRSTSFNDLAELVCNAVGYSPEINHIRTKPVGAINRVGSPNKMLQFYTPRIDLPLGIKMALDGRV